MTEAEAKTRWCPFVQVGSKSPFLGNGQEDGYCISSQCMAWRWQITPEQAENLFCGSAPSGYCGLAGKPCTF